MKTVYVIKMVLNSVGDSPYPFGQKRCIIQYKIFKYEILNLTESNSNHMYPSLSFR